MNASPERTMITQLLQAWDAGDQEALHRLTPMVYQELHRYAAAYMSRERNDHTLQPTALVHETFLRLRDLQGLGWKDRSHFLAVAARIMRRILIDLARARGFHKRWGGKRVALNESSVVTQEPGAILVELDDALTRLAAFDERKSRVVELRYFGGLEVGETAEALGISAETVMREWRTAKAWLRLQMIEGCRGGS